LPAFCGQFRDAVEPARVELAAHVLLEEVLADDAVAFGKAHQAAFVRHEALVDVVELLDERIDARLVEPQRLHLGDDLFLQLLYLRCCAGESEEFFRRNSMSCSCSRRRRLNESAMVSKVSTTFGFSSASMAASESEFSMSSSS